MDTSTHSPHRRAWDTLPWLVAGSASAEDTEHTLQHLPDCADCRAELAFHQQLHTGLQARAPTATELPDAGPAWQRLVARMDLAAATDAAGAPEAAKAHGPAALPTRTAAAPWTRWLVAAVVVQALGLGAAGLALLERSRDGDYRTLSQANAAAPAATVRIVPAPGMNFADLRQLLAQTRMDIVEAGPDGQSFGLAPQDGDPRTSAAALAVLRSAPSVALAEPLK